MLSTKSHVADFYQVSERTDQPKVYADQPQYVADAKSVAVVEATPIDWTGSGTTLPGTDGEMLNHATAASSVTVRLFDQ